MLRKIIALFLALAVLLCAFAGCASKPEVVSSGEASAMVEPAEVPAEEPADMLSARGRRRELFTETRLSTSAITNLFPVCTAAQRLRSARATLSATTTCSFIQAPTSCTAKIFTTCKPKKSLG